jgi:protease YdgD
MQIADHYFGFDDRVLMDTTAFPWSAIGYLEGFDGSGCTATLIADDVLITAAHCIESNGFVNARATFVTAFGDKINGGSAQVVAYFISPDRARDLERTGETAGTDWALLRIDRPLGAGIGHLDVRPLAGSYTEAQTRALTVLQAGYSWDTGFNLSGNLGCSFLAIESQNRVIHNCDTTHGDSGSPLFVRDGDRFYIVATDSTFRTEPGEPAVNVATRTDDWVQYLTEFIAGRIGETNLVQEPIKK